MTVLAIHSDIRPAVLVKPEPRSGPISIRLAEPRDVAFIDGLHKKHSKMVGFLPLKVFQERIEEGHALIAEEIPPSLSGRGLGGGSSAVSDEDAPVSGSLTHPPAPSLKGGGNPIGYCIFEDCYMKHEDVGICYQLNVVPHQQRGLVGAALIKAVFERMPYGVKLFCCWCAQDIEANHFWESLGFVPLAFRAGSRGVAQGGRRKEGRIHIFWQRRIREGDNETPYWYPSETKGGALKEDRIALPIPPGTHWSDAKPMVVPGMENFAAAALPEAEAVKRKPKPKPKPKPVPARPAHVAAGGLWVAPPKPSPEEIKAAKAAESKPKREKQKNDPKLVAAAREFRDRYLDEVNTGRMLPSANGKYDVSRQLAAAPTVQPVPLLNAA